MEEIEIEVIKAIGLQEISDLQDLIVKPGWKVYQEKILKVIFDDQYRKLRKGWMDVNEYSHICGILDGLEKAMNAVDQEIAEYVDNSQEPTKEN